MPASFVQHPLADFTDQIGFFRERNEVLRIVQTEAGMFPANQGFQGLDLTARCRVLRLIVQSELIARNGAAQVLLATSPGTELSEMPENGVAM